MKALLLLLLSLSLFAKDDFNVRIAAGASSASDFDQLYTFTGFNTHPAGTNVYGVSGGYRVVEDMFDWPFDFYVNGSLNYFDENGHKDNFLEGDLYIKLYAKLNLWSNQFRLGIAEGVSYAGDIPYVEEQEAIAENDNQSRFLNYMEITLDFDLGKLIRVKELELVYLGYLIKHRSGFHGTYGGVYDGGSNYNCIYLEKNF